MRNWTSGAVAGAVAAGFLLVGIPAHAATNIYLKLTTGATPGSGTQIDGNVTATGFTNWIDLTSYSWGVSIPTSIGSAGTGSGTGKAVLSDFTWTQLLDQSFSPMVLDAFTGKRLSAVVDLVSSNGGQAPKTYFEMKFANGFINALSLNGTSGGPQVVDGSLDYSKVSFTYFNQSKTGTLTPISASWDLITNTGNLGALTALYALGQTGPSAPVPEPETYAMMLFGIGVMGVVARRKRRPA